MKEIRTESQVVNGWTIEGYVDGELRIARCWLLECLEARFSDELTFEVRQVIRHEESLALLHDWYLKALHSATFADFLAVVRGYLAAFRLRQERTIDDLMTESQVVNGWIKQGILRTQRKTLLECLEARFPADLTEETRQAIRYTDSHELLNDWFTQALRCATFADFLAVLRG